VNSLAIIVGSLIGVLCGGTIPDKYHTTVLYSISLAVIVIGLRMALKADEVLLVILSMAIGSVTGELLRIESRLEKAGKWFEDKFAKAGAGISKGFVAASLVYCVGSMAIVGALESGLAGNHQTLFAKSLLDGVSAIVFASSLGIGVLFSSLSVFVYQGLITLSAFFMKQFLIAEVVNQMSAVGGLLILAIGFNILEIKRIRVGNMLPAIFVPLIYFVIKTLIISF
jgi:uncharacterized membrane protein YqgA involved in biofilm formation